MKYIRASDSFENIAREQSGKILIAFDDLASIFYYGDFLKGYYFRSGKTISDALRESYANAEAIFAECQRFDEKLQNDAPTLRRRIFVAFICFCCVKVWRHIKS